MEKELSFLFNIISKKIIDSSFQETMVEYPYSFKELDVFTGGMKRGLLHAIGIVNKDFGQTILANIINFYSNIGASKRLLIVSQNKEELIKKLIAIKNEIETDKIDKGILTDEEIEKLKYSKLKINAQIIDFVNDFSNFRLEENFDLLIIDNIDYYAFDIRKVLMRLKSIAFNQNIPVLFTTHFKQGVYKYPVMQFKYFKELQDMADVLIAVKEVSKARDISDISIELITPKQFITTTKLNKKLGKFIDINSLIDDLEEGVDDFGL